MDSHFAADSEDETADRVVLNIGGVKFETYTTTLQNISDTRLAWLTENLDGESLRNKEFFFDRHPGVFVHILNYYRTGKLHAPTDICGPLVEEELQFWGIDEKQMEPCCWETFTKHREAEFNLKSFEGPGFEDLKGDSARKISSLSTRGVTKLQLRFDQIWTILDKPHSSKLAKKFSLLSCLVIVLSVGLYCLDTMPVLQKDPTWEKAHVWTNHVCLVFFAFEFITRIIVTPDRKAFLQQSMNWIDFFSLVPSFLMLFLPVHWIQNLVIIRLLRLFRFFKLSYGLQVMLHTLKASSYELTLLLLILLIPLVIFSSLVYFVEYGYSHSNAKFISIPTTFWWCLITMTTVGYGDLVPITWAGQVIGSICAICGLLIVALPISVIGSNFSLYYAHVRARLKLPRKNRMLLQGNLRGLLKQNFSLSLRDRDRKTIKRVNNQAIRRKDDSPLLQDPTKMQLRRMAAFEEIARTAESAFTSLDKLDTNHLTSTPQQPASGRVRRTAVTQLASNARELVREGGLGENVESRSTTEWRSSLEGKSETEEAKNIESWPVEAHETNQKPDTFADIALGGNLNNKDGPNDRKISLKEALNSDVFDTGRDNLFLILNNRKRASSLMDVEPVKTKENLNCMTRNNSLKLQPVKQGGSQYKNFLRSPRLPLLNVIKPEGSTVSDQQQNFNPPMRRARRGALASQVLTSDPDESEEEVLLSTTQTPIPSPHRLGSAKLPQGTDKRKLCKSCSESQAYFSRARPVLDTRIRSPSEVLTGDVSLLLNQASHVEEGTTTPTDDGLLMRYKAIDSNTPTVTKPFSRATSFGRNDITEVTNHRL